MRVIELTQGQVTIVDDEDFEQLAQWRWRYLKGYAVRNARRQEPKPGVMICMHRQIMNPPEGMDIDHINGNPLDNRRCNLRFATRAQNCQNSRIKKNNRTGMKGVGWSKQNQKYRARICTNGAIRHLGSFASIEDAKRAYDEAVLKEHGEFARLN